MQHNNNNFYFELMMRKDKTSVKDAHRKIVNKGDNHYSKVADSSFLPK